MRCERLLMTLVAMAGTVQGFALFARAAAAPAAGESPNVVSLAGEWRFRLDANKAGETEKWFAGELPDRIALPGSTDQGGYGTKTSGPERGWLSRPYTYEGPAWYQRDVEIPASWAGRRVTLFLERCHWETRVWVDDRPAGTRDSLCVPHVYDLTAALTPGRHRLTIRVDNTYRVNVGRNAHSVTEHTQTNWNGIVGRIELRAGDPVWIDAVKATPSLKDRTVRIEAVLGNATGRKLSAALSAFVGKDDGTEAAGTVSAPIDLSAGAQTAVLNVPLGADAALWDEFDPRLHRLSVTVEAGDEGGRFRDARKMTVGLREISTRGTQFLVNGRPTFIRGTLECCIWPLTGYPPTDKADWARVMRTIRSYGLNHLRFHSWCPPEAAFQAADEAGVMFHVELPVWAFSVGKDPELTAFMRAEGRRILDTYGNHPSFTMLCLGNELNGDMDEMDRMVAEFKRYDGRRLYTFSADNRRGKPGPAADYHVSPRTKPAGGPGGPLRIHGHRFGDTMEGTDYDFIGAIKGTAAPTLAHELGQWVVFPDYREIAKYAGVLKPRNLEAFRDRLAAGGMADQDDAFHRASGAFAWKIYKEEMETTLRTRGFGGFQLLDLHDFPGQGEAFVGLLDPFWDSKGILTPEQFRRFCCETVPLLRMRKFAWTTDEGFTATAQVAHYGPKPLPGAVVTWSVRGDDGAASASGSFPPTDIAVGDVATVGRIDLPLPDTGRATHYKVELAVRGTPYANDWDFWVYPRQADPPVPAGLTVTDRFDEAARKALDDGGKVLLLCCDDLRSENVIPTRFLPVFWSLSWFPKQPGTMGVLCDPSHPALAGFPTESHSDWQWWDVAQGSNAFILDGTPPEFRPIVQPIDDYHRNHKLGAIFEARVGKGRLLVCGFDLKNNLDKRPAARQLRRSLLAYLGGEKFDPKTSLDPALLKKLLAPLEVLPASAPPANLDKAVLNVKAAVNVPTKKVNLPWERKLDQVVACAKGFDYKPSAGTWKDNDGAAWPSNDLGLAITCPPGFAGTLYVHFHDWNKLKRRGVVVFEGKAAGTLGEHSGRGQWIALDVTEANSTDGKLELSAQATAGPNLMITQVVLVPK